MLLRMQRSGVARVAAERRARARRSRAWGLFSLALALACGDAPVSLEAIRAQQEAGDLRGSLAPLEQLVKAGSDDPEVHYRYGLALSRLGEPTRAQWSLQKAQEDPLWKTRATLELAKAALSGAGFEAAMVRAAEVLAAEPDNLDALRLHAQAAMQTRRNYEDALGDADRMLALDAGDPDALSVRVVSLLGLKRADEAEESLAALERSVDERGMGDVVTARFCTARAQLVQAKGEIETARERYDACLERFPLDAFLIGEALKFYDEVDRERALAILRAGIEKDPRASDMRMTAAAYLRSLGRPDEAEALLREATEHEDPAVQILGWRDLARHHTERSELDRAADAMRRAVEISESVSAVTPDVLFEYADALILAGRAREALPVAERIPVEAQRALAEGRAQLALENPALALEKLSDANRLWPNNTYARYFAAQAAEQVGDIDRAIEEYRYSIRIDAGATDARLRLARLYLAEDKAEEAFNALGAGEAEAPLPEAGEVEKLRALAQLGRVGRKHPLLLRLVRERGTRVPALLAFAEGVAAREGPQAAAARLGQLLPAAPLPPRDAELLRARVRYLTDAGEGALARTHAAASAQRHPGQAVFQEILGFALERSQAPVEESRRAYQRALELSPELPGAHVALGLLAARAGSLDAAREHAERALAAAAPLDSRLELELAELLALLGRPGDAEKRLSVALRERPEDGELAAKLAALRVERGQSDAETLALALRAERFRAPRAGELVARVRAIRGEAPPEPAARGSSAGPPHPPPARAE